MNAVRVECSARDLFKSRVGVDYWKGPIFFAKPSEDHLKKLIEYKRTDEVSSMKYSLLPFFGVCSNYAIVMLA